MEVKFCFIIACTSGVILLYYYYHNKDRRIERYLLRKNKKLFITLQFSYFVLMLSLVFSSRFIIYELFGKKLMKAAENALKQ